MLYTDRMLRNGKNRKPNYKAHCSNHAVIMCVCVFAAVAAGVVIFLSALPTFLTLARSRSETMEKWAV